MPHTGKYGREMRTTRSSRSFTGQCSHARKTWGRSNHRTASGMTKKRVHKNLPAAGANRCSAGPPQEHRKHHRSCSRQTPRFSHQGTPASDVPPCSESRQPRPIFERIRAGGSSGRRSRAWPDTRGECSCDTHRTSYGEAGEGGGGGRGQGLEGYQHMYRAVHFPLGTVSRVEAEITPLDQSAGHSNHTTNLYRSRIKQSA